MMNEIFTFDVDTEFLQGLYALVGKSMPSNIRTIELKHLKQIVTDVHDKMVKSGIKFDESAISADEFGTFGEGDSNSSSKTALIVDDLGVITYQLSVLFKKMGFETTVSQEIYDAIAKYKKQYYNLVILDLFIPTEREGFLLLDELVKINNTKEKKSVIGIMTASSKKEHKAECRQKGASFYIEKIDDWQKNLVDLCKQI